MRNRRARVRGGVAHQNLVKTASIPAPIGGLNARDSIAEMAPTDAVIMDNYFPKTTTVALRPGYIANTTGFGAAVESLMTYRSATANKMFAASGTAFYDASAAGAVGAAVVSGLTNARWQSANFGTVAGQFLYCVNGVDKARLYDGTKWMTVTDGTAPAISSITRVTTTATLTTASAHGLVTGQLVTVTGAVPAQYNVTSATIIVTGASTFTYTMASDPGASASPVGTLTVTYPVITGVATNLLKDVQIYARRLWFVETNSFRVWYLPVDSIAGAMTSIDFSPLFVLGGSLQGMVTWTLSSELSTTSYAVFMSSEGEAVVYQGTNPDSASGFVLTGSFRVGKPIGQRFYARVGSETVLITEDGLIPLSKAVLINRGDSADAVSYKIMDLISEDTVAYKGVFGWQVILYPYGNKIILNAPRTTIGDTVQYVMNSVTNQWCRYKNIAAYCWQTLVDDIYFGGATAVYKAEYGATDNGAGIMADIQPAFSYFGSPGTQKYFTAVRPIIVSSGNFQPLLRLETDFDEITPTSSPNLSLTTGSSVWDTGLWDTAVWGGTTTTAKKWQTIGGIGFAGAVRMTSISVGMTVELQSFDYVYEVSQGGIY